MQESRADGHRNGLASPVSEGGQKDGHVDRWRRGKTVGGVWGECAEENSEEWTLDSLQVAACL